MISGPNIYDTIIISWLYYGCSQDWNEVKYLFGIFKYLLVKWNSLNRYLWVEFSNQNGEWNPHAFTAYWKFWTKNTQMTTSMVIIFRQLIAKHQSTNKDRNFLLYNHKLQINLGAMLGKSKSCDLFNATVETKWTRTIQRCSIITSLTHVDTS